MYEIRQDDGRSLNSPEERREGVKGSDDSPRIPNVCLREMKFWPVRGFLARSTVNRPGYRRRTKADIRIDRRIDRGIRPIRPSKWGKRMSRPPNRRPSETIER